MSGAQKFPAVGWVIIGVVVGAVAVLTILFFSRSGGSGEGLVSGTENLKPVAGTENLQLVNPNWDFQNTAPATSAPVVVPPTVLPGFKAEYKITGPAAKEIEFRFIPSRFPDQISYEIITKTDKPLQITWTSEYSDATGKIIYAPTTILPTEQGRVGEMLRGGNKETKTDEGAHKLLILLEVKYAN